MFEVIQVIQEFGPSGGTETVAWELARAFDRIGIPNSVVASTVGGGGGGSAVKRVAPWLARVATRGALRHVGRLIVVPWFTIAATLAVRRRDDAVILSHGDVLKGDVLVVHAVNAFNLAEKRKSGKWLWMANPMHVWVGLRDRFMLRGLRYRRYVGVSDRVSHELRSGYSVPEDRIEVIPNGVDVQRYRHDPAAGEAIRATFGIPADAKILLFVGHEFGRKGLEFVARALPLLPQDTWLLVVGSDDQRSYAAMPGAARDRMVFAGERSDLPAFYSAADAFVLPTSYETFSLVCMEAMSCSVPVFATRVGGIESYLKDGVNGFSIRQDAADIAAKIAPVLADAGLRRQLGEGARRTAQDYAWDSVAQRYVHLLSQVWTEKTGGRCEEVPAAA